ncbi:MAG TPA: RHS repeat-associated core domain-containing protein [Anaerolineales bacterium]|nr:RHS repeat-associated core domain-containing protein [Anaerolineales bacterium]
MTSAGTVTFDYDARGNRDSMTVNSVTTDYTYNSLDQLISAGSITYDYDDRGNLSTITNGSNTTNYTYDAADHLTSATAPGVAASYGYDADGRRVTQTFNGQVTNSLWDEASAYGDVVLETNGSGSVLASYVLGGTELLSQTRSGSTNYYLQDGQNSTRALTNGSGTVTDTYSYTAFGELLNQTGSTTNSYLYTGQQYDSLTGLYSLRARYYNPALGRFLSQDTYPYSFSNPVELNRYVYAANSPINLTDPTGNAAMVEYSLLLGGLGGAAFGAVQTYACGGSLLENVFLGALLGLDFAMLAITNPFAATTLGLGFGLHGLGSGLRDMEEHGSTLCNRFIVATSLLAVAASAHGLMEYSLPHQQLNIATIQGESIRPVPASGWNRRPLLPISGGSGQQVIMIKGLGGKILRNNPYGESLVQEAIRYHRFVSPDERITVAVAVVNGRKVVSINGGARDFAVDRIKTITTAENVELIYKKGHELQKHAEPVLYQKYAPSEIGISNRRGPCLDGCFPLFSNLKMLGLIKDIYYPATYWH